MDKYSKFEKIYANIALPQRREIIVVIDNEPISWNVARNEILNRTEKGNEIISKLEKLKII